MERLINSEGGQETEDKTKNGKTYYYNLKSVYKMDNNLISNIVSSLNIFQPFFTTVKNKND